MARMVIPINFTDEDDFKYVKDMANSSHYIRELVRKDRNNEGNYKDYIDKKIRELEEKLLKSGNLTEKIDEIDVEMKNSIKNMFNIYD